MDPVGPEAPDAGTALGGLVLVAGALALLPLCAHLVRRVAPGRRVFFARWGFSHVGLTVAAFLLASLVFGALGQALMQAGYSTVFAGLCTMVLVFGPVAATIGWLALRLDPDGLASLGLWRGGQLRAGLAGLLAYVMLCPGFWGLALAWPWAMGWLELEYEPQAVAVGMLELSGPELLLAIPLAVVVLPFFEELVFRGFLQPLLVQNLGDRGGVAATSVVFGALHGASAFLPIFGLSLILGGVMLRTQRLLGPFLVHALHNGLMLLLLFQSPELRETMGHELTGLLP